jgi:hypothetical protein
MYWLLAASYMGFFFLGYWTKKTAWNRRLSPRVR